jgi:hypothetical protein
VQDFFAYFLISSYPKNKKLQSLAHLVLNDSNVLAIKKIMMNYAKFFECSPIFSTIPLLRIV